MSSSSLSSPSSDRDVLLGAIRKMLLTDTQEPFAKQAQRALILYARANELIEYAKGNDDLSTADQKAMITDGRASRALALATLDEVNEARPMPFMPFPVFIDQADAADGHQQMLIDTSGFLDLANDLIESHAAPFAQDPSGPYESYAQMLVDALSVRRGFCF